MDDDVTLYRPETDRCQCAIKAVDRFYRSSEQRRWEMSSTVSNNNNDRPQSKQGKFAYATIRMPDGTQHEIPLAPKQFKSGREGFYAQIPSFVYNDDLYGGQIQIWKKTK
jgi:hypothetical protein